MEKTLALLNSEEIPDVIQGLENLIESASLRKDYLHASPVAHELFQIWILSNKQQQGNNQESKIEEFILKVLELLLSSDLTDESSRKRLSLHFFSPDAQQSFHRLRNLVEKRHATNIPLSVSSYRLLSSLASVDDHMAKEVQHRFDFKHVLEGSLNTVQVSEICRLFCILLERTSQKRFLLDSSLGTFSLENLQLVGFDVISRLLLQIPLSTCSGDHLLHLCNALLLHPDGEVKEAMFASFAQQVSHLSLRQLTLVAERLEPFKDFFHARLVRRIQEIGTVPVTEMITPLFELKMNMLKMEPRVSFPWFKMVSLICTFRFSFVPTWVSRNVFVRGLLFQDNSLVRLFTLDLLIHLLNGLGSKLEANVLPDVSILLQFHANFAKSKSNQDCVLYFRSLRVLELYAQLRLAPKLDVFRLFPSKTTTPSEEEWYFFGRLLLSTSSTSSIVINPSAWLKSQGVKDTLLGNLLYVLSTVRVQETKETLTLLSCLILQSLSSSAKRKQEMDVVLFRGEERIVTRWSKRLVYFALESPANLEKTQDFLVKQDWSHFETDEFSLPPTTLAHVHSILKTTNRVDISESIARPLGSWMLTHPHEPLVWVLFEGLVSSFVKSPNIFSTVNALYCCLQTEAKIPPDLVLKLNPVLHVLRTDLFPLLSLRVLALIKQAFDTAEFSSLSARAESMCNCLFSHEQRLLFCRAHLDSLSDIYPLLEFDLALTLDPEIFALLFAHPVLHSHLLLKSCKAFPTECSLLTNRSPRLISKCLSNSLVDKELISCLSRLPGIFLLEMTRHAQENRHELQQEAIETDVFVGFDGPPDTHPVALEQLKSSSNKVPKSQAKKFVCDTFNSQQSPSHFRVLAVGHLLTLKRIKASFVRPLFLAWEHLNLNHLVHIELLLQLLELEEDPQCFDAVFHLALKSYRGTLSRKDVVLRQILHCSDPTGERLLASGYTAMKAETLVLSPKSNGEQLALAIQHFSWVIDGTLDARKLRMKIDVNRDMIPSLANWSSSHAEGYDPSYMLVVFDYLLSLYALAAGIPGEDENNVEICEDVSFPAKKWIQGGHVEFVLLHLSSHCVEVRKVSYACLQRFAQLLSRSSATVENSFRDDVLVLLRALKSSIQECYQELPPLVSRYLCEFLHIVFRPKFNVLHYKLVTTFLFSNTDRGWNLKEIPLFYETLNTGLLEEQSFTLNILIRSVVSVQDLPILRKRHCLEILMTKFMVSCSRIQRLILSLFYQVGLVANGGALELLRNGILPFCLGVLLNNHNTKDSFNKVKCSEILKHMAMARLPLMERIEERDAKRLKHSQLLAENWYPRCEWSCDEAEFQLCASQIVIVLSTPNQEEEVVDNLLDFLWHCKRLIRLSVKELSTLLAVCTRRRDYSKLVDVIVHTTSLHRTTKEDFLTGNGKALLEYVLQNGSQDHLAWVASLSRLAPEMVPIPLLLKKFSSCSSSVFLLQLGMIALVGKKTEQESFADKAKVTLVPKLLTLLGENQDVKAAILILLFEALTDGDGVGFREVSKYLSLDLKNCI